MNRCVFNIFTLLRSETNVAEVTPTLETTPRGVVSFYTFMLHLTGALK